MESATVGMSFARAAASSGAGAAWRRALRGAVPVFAVVWLGLGTLQAKESEEARLRARVREYTDAATSAARRDLIVGELDGAADATLARLLRDAIQLDARRPCALELAARLRVPDVFEAARRHADGPASSEVIALALAAPEPAAAAWVADRWRNSEPEGEKFRALSAAMEAGPASVRVVEAVAPSLGDAVRAEPTLRALRVQMAVDDASAPSLAARWPDAWPRFVFEAREFDRDGEDLLAARGWRLQGSRRVGRNLRLESASVVELPTLPLAVQSAAGRFRLRIAPGDGESAFVSFATDGGAQDLRLRCDGRVWFLVEGGARAGRRVEAPFRPGDWTEVEVRLTDPGKTDRPGLRDVRVVVDGTEMRPSGGWWRLSSPPSLLAVGAAVGERPTLLGGVTWRRSR